MLRSSCIWIALLIAGSTRAAAQFFTPLPAPAPSRIIQTESYAYGLYGYVGRPDTTELKALLQDKARLQSKVNSYCAAKQPSELQDDCKTILNVDSLAARGRIIPTPYRTKALPFAWPWAHHTRRNRQVLVDYLEAAHASTDLSVFNQFAANVSSKAAYVTTDVISGLALGALVGIQYAAVVAKDTNQAPDRRNLVEDNIATTMRMINNGGTVTVRILYPLWSDGGTNGQHAASFYTTAGVVGPTGNPDSLRLAISMIGELMNGFAIRGLGSAGDVRGEVVIGVRGGIGWSEHELLAGTGRKTLPFAQLGIGLRQNGRLGLSLLYTFLGNNTVFRPFAPKFIVNFSALR